jgi:hypothetical protein
MPALLATNGTLAVVNGLPGWEPYISRLLPPVVAGRSWVIRAGAAGISLLYAHDTW